MFLTKEMSKTWGAFEGLLPGRGRHHGCLLGSLGVEGVEFFLEKSCAMEVPWTFLINLRWNWQHTVKRTPSYDDISKHHSSHEVWQKNNDRPFHQFHPFCIFWDPGVGVPKKTSAVFGKRKRGKKDTVDDWNVPQNHTFWKLRCPLKKMIFHLPTINFQEMC